MPENQTQPRSDGYSDPAGGPRIAEQAPQPRSADLGQRPSDTEAAHLPDEGVRSVRDPSRQTGKHEVGEDRSFQPDPDDGPPKGSGRDRRLDYGRPDSGRDLRQADAASADRLPDGAVSTLAEPSSGSGAKPPDGP